MVSNFRNGATIGARWAKATGLTPAIDRMTQKKPPKARDAPPKELDMSFHEALQRFIPTDPKERADAFEQNRQRADKIERSVDERRNRLRSANRGPKKHFLF